MRNRDADAGVLVFASSELAPLAGGPLRVFPGNRIICVLDREEKDALALEVAVQPARTLALAQAGDDLPLDRAELASKLASLVEVVETAKGIKRGLSSARRGLDGAEASYEQLREDALALVCELQDRLYSEPASLAAASRSR